MAGVSTAWIGLTTGGLFSFGAGGVGVSGEATHFNFHV
jgi:hypothetical protein